MLEDIIIGFIVAIIIMCFIPAKKWPQTKPKHRRRRSSSHPKALPWFDKDYLKRQEQEKKKYFWDD